VRRLGGWICATSVCVATGCDWIVGISELQPASGSGSAIDAAATGAVDALDHCDGKVTFLPAPLEKFPNLVTEYVPTVTANLTVAFDVKDGNGFDIHEYHLGGSGFTEIDVSELNTPYVEDDPAVTADGLDLFFVSTRNGTMSAYETTRADLASKWGPQNPPMGLNGTEIFQVDVSPDGLTLYLVTSTSVLYQAIRTSRSAPFMIENGPPKATNVRYPTISSDGLELITESSVTGTPGLFEATRPAANGPNSTFATPAQIPTLVTAYDADLSPDDHYLMTGGDHYYVRSCQ
jgi:hypothetical protein